MDGIGISRRASCERRIKPPPRRLRTSSRFQNDNLTRRRQRFHAPKRLYALIVVAVWLAACLNMDIILAGLKNIPTHDYEAARLDGTTKLQQVIYISVP